MDLKVKIAPQSSYRLIELNETLINALESDPYGLHIKAPTGDCEPVLTTRSTTYRLRQVNQTNTLLVAEPQSEDGQHCTSMLAFGTAPNCLEVQKIDPAVDVSSIPTYSGYGKISYPSDQVPPRTVEQLRACVAASDEEFDSIWRQRGGVEVNGVACILEGSVIKSLLSLILPSIQAAKLDFNSISAEEVYKAMDADDEEEPLEIIRAIIAMFSKNDQVPYQLDPDSIVQWLGDWTLREHAPDNEITITAFQELWADTIPISHNWTMDLKMLKGRYVQPTPTTIRYLCREKLDNNPRIRFQQLFAVKSTWDLDEMVPFIDDLKPTAVKLEGFVMKYARKKTLGKRVVVTKR
uniref:ARAD1D34694p n=1 Tax=Blastobotrys adeninivorans TaxID=409370 RepID=A0A060TCA2_BLAAD